MPIAAARGANATGVERLGNAGQASYPQRLDGSDDRQHIGRELIGRGTVRRMRPAHVARGMESTRRS